MTRLKIPSWRTFWRKIKREKRKLFGASPAIHAQYDPNSYSQNFDDGYSNDPDNLSRSFSARFAVPSRIFEKNEIACTADKLWENMVYFFRFFWSLGFTFPMNMMLLYKVLDILLIFELGVMEVLLLRFFLWSVFPLHGLVHENFFPILIRPFLSQVNVKQVIRNSLSYTRV